MVLTCFQGELVVTKWLLLQEIVPALFFLPWRGYLTGLAKGFHIVVRVALVMLESWKCRQKTDVPLHLHDKTLHFLFDKKNMGFAFLSMHSQSYLLIFNWIIRTFRQFWEVSELCLHPKKTPRIQTHQKKWVVHSFISEFCHFTEDVYLKSEVKGKLVSSLLPQSEGKRKEAGPASFGNGPSESSNWYVAGRFDRLISKVNGEDWGWTTWWCTCQLSSQEDMIILKPLCCKSHVHSKVASLVDWWGNQPRTGGPIFGQWTCRLLKNLPNVSRKCWRRRICCRG